MKNLKGLPMDCAETILSHTSARDVCRAAAACSELRLTGDSDVVWESFLPHDYQDIISRAYPTLLRKFGSKKELFLFLCNNPLLIDGGTKMFVLDINSGHKSYVLSARELSIAWSSDPLYWSWKNEPQSRFDDVAELRTTSWLEIHGKFNTKFLSPNTTYGAYLIFNISQRAYGLDKKPMQTLVQVDNGPISSNTVYFSQDNYGNKQCMKWTLNYNNCTKSARNDGWMEIELGLFYNGECGDVNDEVKMSLMEIEGCHLKAGLVIEGIEIRPLN
ncbi:F-box protein PP2-B15-like [Silene latifolia]|uniref:F-box protein PP2-B15-like n=1 Tax=Silene latifolia TaxID=37657 RepID=UPI003D778C01